MTPEGRLYHSASSVALGARCPRAWWLTYREGYRDHGPTWEEIEAGAPHLPRHKSSALGSAVHAVAESYFAGGEPNWYTFPAQILESGIHSLPRPDECALVEVERPIGRAPVPYPEPPEDPRKPPTRILIAGTYWGGFVDLTLRVDSRAVLDRLGLPAELEGVPFVVDHKTSSDPVRWGHTPETLASDLQFAIYAYDLMDRYGLDRAFGRWNYYASRSKRVSFPIDAWIRRDQALDVIAPHAHLARQLDAMTCRDDAEMRVSACADYGGCYLHRSNGGPCDARQSVAARLTRLRPSKEEKRPMSLKARIQAQQAARATDTDLGALEPIDTDPSDFAPSDDAEAEGPSASPEPPAKRAPKGPAAPAPDRAYAKLMAAREKRDAARAKLEEAQAKLAAAQADLESLGAEFISSL